MYVFILRGISTAMLDFFLSADDGALSPYKPTAIVKRLRCSAKTLYNIRVCFLDLYVFLFLCYFVKYN
jgi:hypothetical protein